VSSLKFYFLSLKKGATMKQWKTLLVLGSFLPLVLGFNPPPRRTPLPVYPSEKTLFTWQGKIDPASDVYDPEVDWQKVEEPFNGSRPRGIEALRTAIQLGGLTSVLPYTRPSSPRARKAIEFLYGSAVVYAGDYSDTTPRKNLRGVALHPGNTARTVNRVRGEINPHMGFERLHGSLDKWREYKFAESVQPGFMPATWLAAESAFWQESGIADLVAAAKRGITEAREKHGSIEPLTKIVLGSLVQRFLDASGRGLPHGAFIKHSLGCATFDSQRLITSEKSRAAVLVPSFIESFNKIIARAKDQGEKPLGEAEFWTLLLAESGHWPIFVYDLVYNPTRIIVQEAIEIASTARGVPMEFRVDFIDGEPVLVCPRHSQEILPAEAKQAENALGDFFSAAPLSYRYLSGGADVAITTEGKVRLIEFNFGAESGFMENGVQANRYASILQGKPTPLIKSLRKIFYAPLAAQHAFLREVSNSVLAHPQVNDEIHVYEWLRDRYLQVWQTHPTPAKGRRVLERLAAIFSVAPRRLAKATMDLYEDAKVYVEKN
jgi:hypothetical protein